MKLVIDLDPKAAGLLRAITAHDERTLESYLESVLRADFAAAAVMISRKYEGDHPPQIVRSVAVVRRAGNERRKAKK